MLLGINIDHVATLRNARGASYPSPLEAALVAETNGADAMTAATSGMRMCLPSSRRLKRA